MKPFSPEALATMQELPHRLAHLNESVQRLAAVIAIAVVFFGVLILAAMFAPRSPGPVACPCAIAPSSHYCP